MERTSVDRLELGEIARALGCWGHMATDGERMVSWPGSPWAATGHEFVSLAVNAMGLLTPDGCQADILHVRFRGGVDVLVLYFPPHTLEGKFVADDAALSTSYGVVVLDDDDY